MIQLARVATLVVVMSVASVATAQQLFSELTGPLTAKPVSDASPINIPYITWGGDVATFYANGGLTTQPGSIYKSLGMNIKLTPGDDFVQQVRDYVGGKTPFIRGTYRMLGQASEVLSADVRTKPVIILQLSWSAGDHIVAREKLRTLNDLRGKNGKIKIACQQGGPHVGLLYDTLEAAQIKRDEVEIVWVPDLTGPKGPAELFRKDPTIDACCVISPDMIGLTGGLESTGSGAEGTVAGAHVLNSTQQMSNSIADVYAVRADWYRDHRDVVDKFVAGYLKGTEAVVRMGREFEESNRMSNDYRNVLSMAQNIFGEEVLPTLEVDAHGLLLDCSFVGLPGQQSFFEDAGNLNGYEKKMKAALDMAVDWGYAKARAGFDPPGLDYQQIAKSAGLEYKRPTLTPRVVEGETTDFSDPELLENTIVSFTISFEPNQAEFSADRYGAEFIRAIQNASTFGNAVIVIRGHSDPTKTLHELVRAGIEKGLLKTTGQAGNRKYFLKGRPLDMDATVQIAELIKRGEFEGTKYKPRDTMQAALNLSYARAQAVKQALVDFAKQQKVNLDASQLQPVGAGILEPVIPKPQRLDQARENMRVEFRIVRVPAETIRESEFDF